MNRGSAYVLARGERACGRGALKSLSGGDSEMTPRENYLRVLRGEIPAFVP
jgi:hypothetical protein